MELAFVTTNQVAQLFLLIFSGAVLYKTGLIDQGGKKALSTILMQYVAPAMILDAYMTDYDAEKLHNLFTAFGYSALLLGLSVLAAILATRKSPEAERGIMRVAAAFSNAGYMGFPLVRALFGEEGILYASAYITVFNLLLWSIGIAFVDKKMSAKAMAKKIVATPCIIAVVLGLIVFLGRIPVPTVLKNPVGMVGDMNTPLSMVITGATIGGCSLPRLVKNRNVLWCVLVRLLLTPAAALGVMALLGASGMVATLTLVLTACPCAATTTVFAIQYGKDEELAVGSVAISTLLSSVTLPVYTFLLTALLH